MSKKKRRKNGANGKTRTNGTGTVEKRGGRWLARWYIERNGKRERKSEIIRDLPEGAGIDAARKWLDDRTKADGVTTLDKLRQRRIKELETAEAERLRFLDGLPALPVASAWEVYAATKAGKKLRDRTAYMYKCQMDYFACWLSQPKNPHEKEQRAYDKKKGYHRKGEKWRDAHPFTDISEMRSVSVAVARRFSNHLLDKYSADTHNKHIALLSKIWTAIENKEREEAEGAKVDGVTRSKPDELPPARLITNPWKAIEKEEVVTHDRRNLEPDEIIKVVSAADGEMRLLFGIGIFTGLRLADCALLDWTAIDFERNEITVVPQKSKRKMADGRIKQKIVCPPLLPPLRKMLSAFPAASRVGYVCPTLAADYLRGSDILTTKIQRIFKSVGIKTQTPTDNGKRALVDCGFHSFRHSFCTLCAQSGIPLGVVQSVLGHADEKMTRHYLHVSQEMRNSAMTAFAPELGQAFDTITLEPVALPDVTADAPQLDSPPDADVRLRAFRAAWDALTTNEERRRALAYAKGVRK